MENLFDSAKQTQLNTESFLRLQLWIKFNRHHVV